MKYRWSRSTIIFTSILFTPVVGGVLVGLNQVRLGHPKRQWYGYTLGAATFVWYALYFYAAGGTLTHLIPIPQAAILVSALRAPLPFLALFLPPSVIAIAVIDHLQRGAEKRTRGPVALAPGWTAYVLGAILTLPMGFMFFLLERELVFGALGELIPFDAAVFFPWEGLE